MYNHLMQNGITRGYTTWNYHGGESNDDDDGDGDDVPFDGSDGGGDDMSDDDPDEMIQRLFIDKQVASDMRWHKEKQVHDDNIARHPANTEAWKHLDKIDPPFARDLRNIRLGLATDGFNPFGNLSSSYIIWPVFIVPYNLPPWKCMKDPYMFMSMLIPGPKSPLNIDVYLEPLIDELKDLWAGVDAYDALRKEDFTLRAALLWTINDFPTYGMLYGWSVKGYKACPTCMDETSSHYLKWVDNREPIAPKSGDEVLHDIDCSIGVSHSVVNKKKHLMDRGLKKSLHLQRRGESFVIPMACYHLTKDEKRKISNLLMSLKSSNGLASNISRKMHILKGYVTNKARPEGCIAQRYIENECVTFCSMYLNDVDTVFNKSERNDEMIHPGGEISVFSSKGRPIGGYKSCDLSEAELMKIHTYILNNCPEMGELINEHKVELEEENFNHVNERHDKEFASWLQQRVNTHLHSVASEIRILSRGPLNSVNSYSGCMVNGYKFHTQTREENRTCQNSRVVVRGDHGSSMIDYFGILQEVLEVVYLGGSKRVLVFKCEWFKVDNANGLQVDKESGSTSVNTSRKWYVDQPYILASQAKQVFYVPNLKLGRNWYVVESNDPRTLYNVPVEEGAEAERHHVDEVFQEEEPHLNMPVDSNLNQPSLTRGSVPLEVVDASTAYDDSRDDEFSDDDDDDIDSTKSLSSSHEESPLDDCSDSE
ncbi:transposon protein, CACTA, En/Spm sub-class [Tanacetum coccineum]